MKKFVMATVAALSVFSACAADSSNSGNGSNFQLGRKNSGKILVAYYSASGTTKSVAEKIASYLGADLFEVVPKDDYTSADLDWTNRNSRVYCEHDTIFGSKANGTATVSDLKKVSVELKGNAPDLSGYETVFIGAPIWWGIAAWPVNGFVEGTDFKGKTVVPFCTSMSSGLGRCGELLHDLAGKDNGTWLIGKRFGTRASESEVRGWIDSIGVDLR